MTLIRRALRYGLELSLASKARHRLALHYANRDGEGTFASARERQRQTLRKGEVGPGESGELFILGSSPSVLEVSPSFWERVRRGTSIGLNSWVLHDFVPDIYGFEEMESDSYIQVAQGISKALQRSEVIGAQPLILHLRPHSSTPSKRLISVPPALAARTRYYGRFSVVTRRLSNLKDDIAHLLSAAAKDLVPPHVFLDAGSSVARMVYFGTIAGFNPIVLVGVDLFSSDYFFETDPSYLRKREIEEFNPSLVRAGAHPTETRIGRDFKSSEFLPSLAMAAELTFGTRVCVASESSKLADYLPLFQAEH